MALASWLALHVCLEFSGLDRFVQLQVCVQSGLKKPQAHLGNADLVLRSYQPDL
jgi:hypothetical protein